MWPEHPNTRRNLPLEMVIHPLGHVRHIRLSFDPFDELSNISDEGRRDDGHESDSSITVAPSHVPNLDDFDIENVCRQNLQNQN